MLVRIVWASVFIPLLFLQLGCSGPSDWAVNFEAALECGMTVEEVEALAGQPLRYVGPGSLRPWRTHMLDGDERYLDDVDLGFVDGKLHYVQVYWGKPWSTMIVERPRRDLCAG